MPKTVSKIAAFVFENGAMAEQILFRDLEKDGELPGVSSKERAAMSAVEPELRETWVSILSACRQALLRRAHEHLAESALRSKSCTPSTMWEHNHVQMVLSSDELAYCGVSLEVQPGRTQYQLFAWILPDKHWHTAVNAVAKLVPEPDWEGSTKSDRALVLPLKTPKEGDNIEDLAEAAAEALWSMARPIAEAIEAGRRA
jgi:hypothetical protein